jgi:hypothetical protein
MRVAMPGKKEQLTGRESVLFFRCMSARKIEMSPLGLSSNTTQCLNVPANSVRIRKNGIEFRHDQPLVAWTEMTVTLQGNGLAKKVNFTGVIVACQGDPESGYEISMLFTHVTRLSQARLLAYS